MEFVFLAYADDGTPEEAKRAAAEAFNEHLGDSPRYHTISAGSNSDILSADPFDEGGREIVFEKLESQQEHREKLLTTLVDEVENAESKRAALQNTKVRGALSQLGDSLSTVNLVHSATRDNFSYPYNSRSEVEQSIEDAESLDGSLFAVRVWAAEI